MQDNLQKNNDELLDRVESELLKHPAVELPVIHRFVPGMYIREIHIPAGTMLTSMKHKTEHPFTVSKGKIRVSSANEGSVTYEAPHTGITKPGTRRALFALTDVVWTTYHVTNETDIEKIGETILEPHENKILQQRRKKILPGWRKSLPLKKPCPTLP